MQQEVRFVETRKPVERVAEIFLFCLAPRCAITLDAAPSASNDIPYIHVLSDMQVKGVVNLILQDFVSRDCTGGFITFGLECTIDIFVQNQEHHRPGESK